MRHKNGTASPGAKHHALPLRAATRGISTSPRVDLPPLRRNPLAAALFLALNGGAALAAGPGANGIVVDGRTQTGVQVNGATTNITTSTIQGGNAFNSFSRFSVGQGNTVNLHVPGAVANLVNVVRTARP
jgi:hypothetical protein